jgi:hypothetical protein
MLNGFMRRYAPGVHPRSCHAPHPPHHLGVLRGRQRERERERAAMSGWRLCRDGGLSGSGHGGDGQRRSGSNLQREQGRARDKMFVLVVHTITDVTAKVPFAMMVLQDALKTKAIPSHLKVSSPSSQHRLLQHPPLCSTSRLCRVKPRNTLIRTSRRRLVVCRPLSLTSACTLARRADGSMRCVRQHDV